MAMTASLAISPSTVIVNQVVSGTLTVSNSGGSAVNVTGIAPYVISTGSSEVGNPVAVGQGAVNLGPGVSVSVPASGSLTFPLSWVPYAPSTGILSAGSGTYNVGATVYTSDGSVFKPTEQTVTANYLTFPSSQQ